MMAGSPAFAQDGNDDNHIQPQLGLLNVADVLNDLDIGLCDWDVNILAIELDEVLNDLGLNIPILSPGSDASDVTSWSKFCVADTHTYVDDGH
ncbi:hypothetical protein SAMN05421810_10395 [Amycolatopsis arida]|uniref:Uncharacterized protein n=2 Tax=Amycolatopsis arida TaxID=587909 RepID=A0A1I5SCL6_9PSEU|nr:hypothetical protein CLV69_103663 [Amycolatopsis arida]SFP68485.1 hypothetical protein SAMN05421810_10395 [Amycolatopsis arida]